MHEGTVEKRALRQTKVGDGIAVVEALNIWPVFLSCSRGPIGRCGKCHLTLEHIGKGPVDVGLITINDDAFWQGDTDRPHLDTRSWEVSQHGAEVEQRRPLPGGLSAWKLPV